MESRGAPSPPPGDLYTWKGTQSHCEEALEAGWASAIPVPVSCWATRAGARPGRAGGTSQELPALPSPGHGPDGVCCINGCSVL